MEGVCGTTLSHGPTRARLTERIFVERLSYGFSRCLLYSKHLENSKHASLLVPVGTPAANDAVQPEVVLLAR